MAKGVGTLFCAVAALLAATPAQAAFPGRPGPIAYSYSSFGETGAGEFEGGGGIFSHGPRKREAPRQLTQDSADSSPSYSPDGRLIAFSGNRGTDPEEATSRIFVMKRDGSGVRQLTDGGFADSNPSFSPDGRRVVFDRGGAPGQPTQIFSVSIDGGEPRQISDGTANDYDPVFTPNGRRIVFVSDRRASGRRDRSNIFSMRPNGSHVRLLIGGPRSEFDPDVSPNGRFVAFASNRSHGPNIFVARMSGRHVRALTHSRGDCFRGTCYTSPAWSPDGRHIACLASGRYKSDLEVMRSDGRGPSKEFAEGGTEEEGYGSHVGAPSWGPRPR